MRMKISPYSEKKVKQEIPVLATSESSLQSCLKRCPTRQHQTLLVLIGIPCGFVKQEIFQKHKKMVPETSVHT